LVPDIPVAALIDLLDQPPPPIERAPDGKITFTLQPAASHCLAPVLQPQGLAGAAYRRARAQAAWAGAALSHVLPPERIPDYNWRELAKLVEESPARLLAAVSELRTRLDRGDQSTTQFFEAHRPIFALIRLVRAQNFPRVVRWTPVDRSRITLVPPDHWLLVEDAAPFRVTLDRGEGTSALHAESVPVRDGFVAGFAPSATVADATFHLERYDADDQHVDATIRFLEAGPSDRQPPIANRQSPIASQQPPIGKRQSAIASQESPVADRRSDIVLLTNGRGGMARLRRDLGHIASKYDCLLGANFHASFPVDRHILAKRFRVWANAHGFISPLDDAILVLFDADPAPRWVFAANAGDGQIASIVVTANMLADQNAVVVRFERTGAAPAGARLLPDQADVR
ncbi:MAG: glycogen debranching enzyme N-terminal domain-containing protein, partial [Pedosphaera parvula]|nr:glycogen debranching enzyme N-terminal domain-containing protein [Pedosphaera parvula]